MQLIFILIAFALAVLMGASFAALLAQMRPAWSARRRMVTAASALPAITIVATLLGILFVSTQAKGAEDSMRDLAVAAVGTLGGFFAFVAFGGGLVGAALAQHRRVR
jgi:flagellar motor component MotA